MDYKTINHCRVCGNESLISVLNLGEQFSQGQFLRPDELPQNKYPLHLVRCAGSKACGLVQLWHTVNPRLLFRKYWYQSSISQTMRSHLQEVSYSIFRYVEPKSILDIGCNDGSLLTNFSNERERVGIDPSDVNPCIDSWVDKPERKKIAFIKGFFPQDMMKSRTFDAIFSIACFYDTNDPISFARAVRDLLSTYGVWCLEVASLHKMLENLAFDAICFEHLCYYNLDILHRIMETVGLKIVGYSQNESNGGSIRLFITHRNNQKFPDVYLPYLEERIEEIDYAVFRTNCELARIELQDMVFDLRMKGKRIHILGASTKLNTILQWCGFNTTHIEFASDRDPRKYGCLTPGTQIPIISEEESRAKKPDVYLVGPSHFRKELLEREKEFLASGGQFLFPLPQVELVKQ